MKRKIALLAVAGLIASALVSAPAAAEPDSNDGPTVYVGEVDATQLKRVTDLGIDREDLTSRGRSSSGKLSIEVVLTPLAAAKLKAVGVELSEKKIDGTPAGKRLREQNASGYNVFRSYSEVGGIRDELVAITKAHPKITKLVSIGKTTQGKDILAVKVTNNATKIADGKRPAVLYASAQHAREWITPEMNRRLLHYFVDGYASNAAIRRIVADRELWFVPVANPDGYDYTFTEDHRLWRKTLRDNDGDGQITAVDGVDPNRNYPTHWGYDNEGSSPIPASETYRGPGPASEPETKALNGLMRKIGFAFLVNYHSAAELLLYGVGFQVATPSPDDLLYETLAGDDAHPAIPGYDSDISAELYTTNGDTDDHAHQQYGTLAFTPEMTTCETASAIDPDDAFDPADCASGFNFPDSEPLIQAEFEKNLPFALSLARSAKDPDNPISAVGRTAPDFAVDSFTTSYGSPQPVAVTARRDLTKLGMKYKINGGRTRTVDVKRWRGGERYGTEGTDYYAEYRGTVRGAKKGDKVRVWFTGRRPGKGTRVSEKFTYQLAENTNHKVLVLTNEDYEGVNPESTPNSRTSPKYAAGYAAALKAAGYPASIWDVSKQGVPHDLGVLSHFDAVVWYLGDNRLTQDPEDTETDVYFSPDPLPDAAVAERQQYLTIAVRDYLNEGGKLVHSGETAGYFGLLGADLGGIYYGLNGDPTADCVVTEDPFADCLLLADDFFQYYLGAYSRAPVDGPTSFQGSGVLAGRSATFGGPALADNPLDEAGTFIPTSKVLPESQFPLFASQSAGLYRGIAGGAFDPIEGSWYVGGIHVDDSYMRLTRTVDLRTISAADAPTLRAKLSFDTEPGYDNVIVEAHTAGQDDWTTLPETGGLTSNAVPTECEAGFLLDEHPFLEHYLTGGDPCGSSGTTGVWNAMTGNSGGWQTANFDLAAYAGKQVEVSISYVTDPGGGGAGVVIDDTAVVIGGTATSAEGFETGLGPWAITPPPAGSPTGGGSFARAQSLFSAAISTKDTVLLGFGLEQVGTPAARTTGIVDSVRSLISRGR